MIAGLIIFILGLLMLLFTWLSYHRAAVSLSSEKQEDLVSYYLDLAIRLVPLPFWCGLIGIIISLIGLIIILINIPW